jgi:hypothetical protein
MSASRIFCPSCGAENKAQDRFCTACGSSLPVVPAPVAGPTAPAPGARKKASNWPLLVTMGAVFILLMVVVVEAVVIVMSPGAVPEIGATLSVVEGKVFVQESGQGNWMQVAEDFVIQAGDRIRVGGGSKALLTFLENTTTELRSFTELTVTDLQLAGGQPVVASLDLGMGEIWNKIGDLPLNSIHEVTTAAARVVSLGTQYGVAVDQGGTTWLAGHEGVARVSGGGRTVDLGAGQTLVVKPGAVPEPFVDAATAPSTPVEEPQPPANCALEGVELPTFLNEPQPTTTPTSTATATTEPTHTATATSTPTATATRISCPTLTIRLPSGAPPHLPFGIEWDVTGAPVPSGYGYTLDFSHDQASWQRASIWRTWQEGGYMHAEVQGPGEGHFYWRICLVNSANVSGPSECCGPSHAIIHARDEGAEEEEEEEDPIYYEH